MARLRTTYVAMGLMAAIVAFSAESASAQSLLERLEKRLQGALVPTETPADPAGAPAAGEPTPAIPPPDPMPDVPSNNPLAETPAGVDELPAPAPQGYLGLTGDDTDEDGKGVRVVQVKIGSPAAKAGILVGDLVTGIGEEPVGTIDEMQALLTGLPVGAKVDFQITRGMKKQTSTVTLGNRPADETTDMEVGPEQPALRPFSTEASRASLGITVIPLTQDLQTRYGVSVRRGAFISQVRPGSPADTAGLPIGGVIVAIDGRRIDTSDELVSIIAASRPGQEVELTYYQGATLARKSVRLAASTGTPAPGATVPGLPLAGDRPVIRRVEQMLQQFTQPGGAPGFDPGAAPAADPRFGGGPAMDATSAMEAEIAALKDRILDLEDRLMRLEKKLPASDDPLLLPPPPKNQLP